jgi:hypothetical protein
MSSDETGCVRNVKKMCDNKRVSSAKKSGQELLGHLLMN